MAFLCQSKMVEVEGHVSPGFESVSTLFRSNMERGVEELAQLCVYHDNELVVDLVGRVLDREDDFGQKKSKKSFDRDSLLTLFSTGKTVVAIAFACLVDRGYIDYDTRIKDVWPEFELAGDLVVADLFRNEAGLVGIDESIDLDQFNVDNIKKNGLGNVIQRTTPTFPPDVANTRREYHAFTGSVIINEIFRRVEPQGRTMGEFLRSEISSPLNIDVYMGVNSEELDRVTNMTAFGIWYTLLHIFLPKFLGKRVETTVWQFVRMILAFISNLVLFLVGNKWYKRHNLIKDIKLKPSVQQYLDQYNDKRVHMAEIPSFNTVASARGLAKLGATILNKGVDPDDSSIKIISEEGIKKMCLAFKRARDLFFPQFNTFLSQGGINWFRVFDTDTSLDKEFKSKRENFLGWISVNGSAMHWHPQLKISFGYTKNRVCWSDPGNLVAANLEMEVVRCVQDIKSLPEVKIKA